MFNGGSRHTAELARTTSVDPATRRRRSKPVPGQPPAKVEYKRRTTYLSKLLLFLNIAKANRNPKKGRDRHSLEIPGGCVEAVSWKTIAR